MYGSESQWGAGVHQTDMEDEAMVSFHQYEKGRVNGCESKLMLILIN